MRKVAIVKILITIVMLLFLTGCPDFQDILNPLPQEEGEEQPLLQEEGEEQPLPQEEGEEQPPLQEEGEEQPPPPPNEVECEQLEGESQTESEGEISSEGSICDALEADVFEAVNQVRVNHGLSELLFDCRVQEIARVHSQDMAENNFFSHYSSTGENPGERLARAQEQWVAYGENIAYCYGYADPVQIIVEGWMQNPGHRANILDPNFSHTGVGVAFNDAGYYFFTQDFVGFK